MKASPEPTRLTIELDAGDGGPRGRLLAEGLEEPRAFAGWLELVSHIESARSRKGATGPPERSQAGPGTPATADEP